jgi:histidine phosphotransfer protein HptB
MTDQPILNPEAIETLRSLNPDDSTAFLKELIDIYLQDTPERMAEITTGLAAQDAATVMRAAHSIKGSSSNFGATALADLAHLIEIQGKTGNLTETGGTLVTLHREYDRVAAALTALTSGT